MNTTNENVSLFDFNGHQVRVVQIEGEPWFVASDVCLALDIYVRKDGYPNTYMACVKLDDDEKRAATTNPIGRSKFTRSVIVVSESGLYKLVMRSDKPNAKAFQDWVTREVLPSIRKDGG